MNSVDLTGRIANDIQVKKTNNGKSVMNINLAVKRNRETTDFISIVLWGQAADYLADYSKKGDLIGVYNGTLQSRKYEDKTYWEIHAFNAEILSHSEAKKDRDDNYTVRGENRSQTAQKWAELEIQSDDLPFGG